MLGTEKRSLQIHIECFVPRRLAEIHDVSLVQDAGIVHKNIDSTKFRLDDVEGCPYPR